jgi:hypothetical protein
MVSMGMGAVCHTQFGQFLGSHQTLVGGEVGIFVDSILQFLMQY